MEGTGWEILLICAFIYALGVLIGVIGKYYDKT